MRDPQAASKDRLDSLVGGVVLRPAAFQRPVPAAPPAPARRRRRRWLDGRVAAILIAIIGLAWLLAIAGTAFAIRMVPVMCFALLAGRERRLPQPHS